MPYNLVLDNIFMGYALESVKNGGEIHAAVREFTSSEDGDLFISRLEGIPSELIGRLPSSANVNPSMVDHLLAIIRRDKTATVYVNEVPFRVTIRPKRPLEKGELIYIDDVADIQSIDFIEIPVPNDAGIILVFSDGWRKGLFYDFGPLVNLDTIRTYDLGNMLGSYFAYLFHQNLFKVTKPEWQSLFDQQWFPFITLKKGTINKILEHVRNSWPVDELLNAIAEELLLSIDRMLQNWSQNTFVAPHVELIKQAVNRYREKDYVSTTSIVYPRIEGIMRSLSSEVDSDGRASPKNLVNTVIGARKTERHPLSLLLPQMFSRFLEEVYFANFDPQRPAKLSRHSIAHGVAATQEFSLKGATLGLLIIDQISYFLPSTI